MNEEQLSELLKYSNSKELFIVNYNNLLKQLICPFRVLVLHAVLDLKKGQIVLVDQVKVTMELKTVYIINNKAFYYFHFDIIYP